MLIDQLRDGRSEIDSAEVENLYALPVGRHVRVNFVVSLDGAVEIDGRSSALGGPADREVFISLRAVSDVILVGAGTVRAERYGPVRLDAGRRERRASRSQSALPRLAVVTNSGELDPSSRLFEKVDGGSDILVVTTTRAAVASRLADHAEVLVCGDATVDLGAALDALSARGLDRVLCEGGPTLTRSLLERDLVDELCVTVSPILAGAGHRRLLGDEPLAGPFRFDFTSVFAADGLLMTRYTRP